MKFIRLNERGITLPELILTAAIFAMMGMGIMSLFTEFSRQYKYDAIESDLSRYASLAIDEIEQDMKVASEISIDGGVNGMDQAHLTIPGPTSADPPVSITYTADDEQGLLVNGEPVPRDRSGSAIVAQVAYRFPDFGEYFKNGQLQVRVDEFNINNWEPEGASQMVRALRQNAYEIELHLALDFPGADETVTRYKRFRRIVFLDRTII